MPAAPPPIVIVGAGLTGSLTALALMKFRPTVPFLLVEQALRFGGGPISPFFLDTIPLADGGLIDPLIVRSWLRHYIATTDFSRLAHGRIVYLLPEQLHAEIVERIPSDRYLLAADAVAVRGNEVLMADGLLLKSSIVLDARGRTQGEQVQSRALRHVVTRQIGFDEPHGLDHPILIDSNFQESMWDFLQYFPLDPYTLLLQYIAFSQDVADRSLSASASDLERGRLLSESVSAESLRSAPAVDASGGDAIAIHSSFAEMWDPVLPTRVAAAVRIASTVAAQISDAPQLRRSLGDLARRTAQHLARRTSMIEGLCDYDRAVRRENILSLCRTGGRMAEDSWEFGSAPLSAGTCD